MRGGMRLTVAQQQPQHWLDSIVPPPSSLVSTHLRRMPLLLRPPLPPSTEAASFSSCSSRPCTTRRVVASVASRPESLWTMRRDDGEGEEGGALSTTTTTTTPRQPPPTRSASPCSPSTATLPARQRAAPPPLFSRRRVSSSSSSSSSNGDLAGDLPDPKTVLGWKVIHSKTGKSIGVVREVTAGSSSDEEDDDDDEEEGGGEDAGSAEQEDRRTGRRHRRRRTSSPSSSSCSSSSSSSSSCFSPSSPSPPSILRVVNADVPPRFGPGAAEHHLLPYVRDVIPAARPASRTLVASPPRGLLRLGRQRLLIEYLKPRLHAIARELAGGVRKEETAAAKKEEEKGKEEGSDVDDDFDPERDFIDDNESDDDDFRDLDAPRSSSSRTALMMPTLAQLAAWRGSGRGGGSGNSSGIEEEDRQGRNLGQQLVRDVRDAGGAAAVAAAVGLRAKRRPVGYWDNLDTLDEELALFVAAHWVELSTSDFGAGPTAAANAAGGRRGGGGGRYYFNVATRRVRWDAPIEPTTLEIDDCGTRIRIEGGGGGSSGGRRRGQRSSSSSSERLMPGRAAVLAAGRYDLHHAIVYHGGYRAVQEMLSRLPAWPPSAAHDDPEDLGAELRAFARAARRGRPRSSLKISSSSSSSSSPTSSSSSSKPPVLQMPTLAELADAGRSDLVQAVVRAGGVRAAAAIAGLAPRRPRLPGDASAPAANLEAAAEEIRKFVASSSSSSGNASNCLPTHAELLRAGRGDLRYALQAHGSAAVAAATGLEVPRRGRRKGWSRG